MSRRWVPGLDTGAVVFLAVCALVLHRDGLLGAVLFFERDTELFYYPLAQWVGEQLKAGQYPLWVPGIFTGYPIFADGELGLLYLPQVALLWLLPTPVAIVWLRVLHAFLAGLFTFLFLRTLRLDPLPSLGGALVFAFGSFLTAQMHHENMVRSAVWLPAVLTCVERAVRTPSRARGLGWAGLGALAFAQSALGLHVQPALMTALAVGGYVLFRALTCRHWWPLAVGAAIGLGGAGLAAAQMVPLGEWALLSFRRGGVSYDFASAFGLPVENLPTLLFPYFFRLPDASNWWTLWQQWEITLYVGIPTLALIGIGVVFARHATLLYFIPLGVLSLLIAMAQQAPFLNLHLLLWSIPGFSFLRAPGRFSYLIVFACAGLAALGLQALADRRPRMLVALVGGLPMVALLAAVLALLPAYRARVSIESLYGTYLAARAQYGLDPTAVLNGFQSSSELSNPKTLWSLALLLLTALGFVVWLALGARRAEVGRGVFVGLLAVDLLVFAYDYHPRASAISFIPVLPDGLEAGQRALLYDYASLPDLEPNQLLAAGVSSVEGYSSLPSQRHVELYAETLARPALFDLWSAERILEPVHPRDGREVNGVRFRASHPVAAGFGGGAPATFRVPPDFGPIDAVRLIGTLSFAFNVPQGTPVATVMLSSGETLPIRAGIELSERAFDRPSLGGVLQHQRAQVADDFEEVTAAGEAYLGHLYQADMRLPAPSDASEISIVPTDPRALLQVYGLALVGPRGVRSLEAADRSGLHRLSPSVIENTHALPRAYVLPRVQAFSPARHPALTPTQLVANRDVDVHTQVLVEGEPGLSAEPAPPTTQAVPASIQEVRPNELRLTASADVSSYVVVTDFYHRGWVAYVDGERTRVLIANALFRAVPIEAGQHTIELRFEPLSHVVGAAVSILALLLTLGTVAFGFKAR